MAFDLVVHTKDDKGRIVQSNPYVYVCSKEGSYFLRNGVKYHEDGSLFKDAEPPKVESKEIKFGEKK